VASRQPRRSLSVDLRRFQFGHQSANLLRPVRLHLSPLAFFLAELLRLGVDVPFLANDNAPCRRLSGAYMAHPALSATAAGSPDRIAAGGCNNRQPHGMVRWQPARLAPYLAADDI